MVSDASLTGFVNSIGYRDFGVISREFGASRLLARTERDPQVPLFVIEGSETYSVGNIISTRDKLYRAIGVDNDKEAYRRLLRAITSPKPLQVEGVPGGLKRASKGLLSLPFTRFYRGDGGLYLTASIIVACWKGVCNASFHRIMLIDEKTAVVRLVPRHLYRMYNEAIANGESLPVTVILGVHPTVLLAAASSPKYGVFELEVASSLLGGMRVFESPIHHNPVPYHVGAIIEGFLTEERASEGPFADILLLYDKVRKEPVLKVKQVYISDEFTHVILPGGMEHILLMGFPREAQIWEAVSRVVPRVYKVRLTRGGGGWLHAIISIDKNHDGDGKNAILAAFAAHPSLKHVIVVDNDIDPDDLNSVEWAIATRFQADRDLVVIREARGSTLDPSGREGYTAKMGIDATLPDRKMAEKFTKASFPES